MRLRGSGILLFACSACFGVLCCRIQVEYVITVLYRDQCLELLLKLVEHIARLYDVSMLQQYGVDQLLLGAMEIWIFSWLLKNIKYAITLYPSTQDTGCCRGSFQLAHQCTQACIQKTTNARHRAVKLAVSSNLSESRHSNNVQYPIFVVFIGITVLFMNIRLTKKERPWQPYQATSSHIHLRHGSLLTMALPDAERVKYTSGEYRVRHSSE